MDYYFRARDAIDTMKIGTMSNRKDLITKGNDELTKVIREVCGLD